MKYSRDSLEKLKEIDPTTVANPVSGEVIRGVYQGLHWTRNSAGVIVYGQTALTNPITGTGTTNYIPKFTGASSLGNSQIFDNGTNVGIGTTNPSTLLEIFAPLSSQNSVNPIITSLSPAGGSTSNGIYSVVETAAPFGSGMLFKMWEANVGLVEKVRISHNGNVGIGYSSGTEITNNRLAVNGSGYFSGAITAASFNSITGLAGNGSATTVSKSDHTHSYLPLAGGTLTGDLLGTNIVTNETDTYTATAKVTKMITLSQTEYNAIGTKDTNTMYIII